MRWITVATMAALAATSVDAVELAAVELPRAEAASTIVSAELSTAPLPPPTLIEGPEPVLTVSIVPSQETGSNLVSTVNLIAAPVVAPDIAATPQPITTSPPVAALAPPSKLYTEIRPAKRPTSKGNKLAKSLLSRTARQQLALLATMPKAYDPGLADLFDNEDAEFGADAVDLQVFYSRPRLIQADLHDRDDDFEISDEVRLRLFMARMRAIDAHKMAQLAKGDDDLDDDGLSDTVKLRLAIARMKAVRAHQQKFS